MASVIGRIGWSAGRDAEGHRTYMLKQRVLASSVNEGPAAVMVASGLPLVGTVWNQGTDLDGWAFCTPVRKVQRHRGSPEHHPGIYWDVETEFSTNRNSKRCQDETIEDPLLEPDRISGSFVKYVREVTKDKDGNRIKTSSHEVIRGAIVEFDHNRPTVTIGQNTATLGLATFSDMVDTVNDATLWGLGSRKIKLSNVSWTREYFGTCDVYYTRTFEFDIDFNTFDREALDEGTKVLNGHWSTDQTGTGTGLASTWVLDDIDGAEPTKTNPQHFIRYKDRNGENTRVVLDGNGQPLDGNDTPYFIPIQYYPERNFLSLGIPSVLA